jgi:uncharacterized protein YjbJ (UPF0337 family)
MVMRFIKADPECLRDKDKTARILRKGKIKEQWGKLMDDQLDQIRGNQLVGRIQECYGVAKDKAESQVGD